MHSQYCVAAVVVLEASTMPEDDVLVDSAFGGQLVRDAVGENIDAGAVGVEGPELAPDYTEIENSNFESAVCDVSLATSLSKGTNKISIIQLIRGNFPYFILR